MAAALPQIEGLPRGGSDAWDQPQASGVLQSDVFGLVPSASPIKLVQIADRVIAPASVGASQASASFSEPVAVGNYVVAIVNLGAGYDSPWTSLDVGDNQSGNSWTTRVAVGSNGGGASIAYTRVVSSSNTFTVTANPIGGDDDVGVGLQLLEVAGLDATSVEGILVTVGPPESVAYSTEFDVTTSATSRADELMIVTATSRSLGTFNDAPAPEGYTELFRTLTGDAAGVGYYRLLTEAGPQSINLGGFPQDGSPTMIVLTLRGPSPTVFHTNWCSPTQALGDSSGTPFSNLSSLYASDDSRATVTLAPSTLSEGVFLWSFEGLYVPPGATILGIEVSFEGAITAGSLDYSFWLLCNSNTFTPNSVVSLAPAFGGSEATFVAGGPEVLWGGVDTDGGGLKDRDWLPADFNTVDFGVYGAYAASASGATIAIDHIKLRVRYTFSTGSTSTITAASGAGTTSTVVGSAQATGATTVSAGMATSSLVGASQASSAATVAAGLANTSLVGRANAQTSITSAAGTSSTSLIGRATVLSTVNAAAGTATTTVLVGSSSAASSSTIGTAQGVSTVSTLVGQRTAAATLATAAGVGTASLSGLSTAVASVNTSTGASAAVLVGNSTALASPAIAAGVATAALNGRATVISTLAVSPGAATAAALLGQRTALATATAAVGTSLASLVARSNALAALTASAGTSNATLVGQSAVAAAINAALGLTTASTFTARANVRGVLGVAVGLGASQSLQGSATARGTVTTAAGTSTTSTLIGRRIAVAYVVPVVGTSTAQVFTGLSHAVGALGIADGTAVTATVVGVTQRDEPLGFITTLTWEEWVTQPDGSVRLTPMSDTITLSLAYETTVAIDAEQTITVQLPAAELAYQTTVAVDDAEAITVVIQD